MRILLVGREQTLINTMRAFLIVAYEPESKQVAKDYKANNR